MNKSQKIMTEKERQAWKEAASQYYPCKKCGKICQGFDMEGEGGDYDFSYCQDCWEDIESTRKAAETRIYRLKEIEANLTYYMQERGFPARFLGVETTDLFPDRQELLSSRLNSTGLFITGGCGTGKTTFLCALGKELTKTGVEVWFKNTPELSSALVMLYTDFKKGDEKDVLRIWAEKPYLILDDFDIERVTPYIRESIYILINTRYERNLPTFITSNHSLEYIETHLGDRIASRICEMCEMIDLGDEDLRLQKRLRGQTG
jgi:DNA replication protein DnaC